MVLKGGSLVPLGLGKGLASLVDVLDVGAVYGVDSWERLLLPLTPYTLEGEYFLQTAPGLASCHDWVVSRVMPLMLHRLLMAWVVMFVTRQVIQAGLHLDSTRTGCNRRVFLLGSSASTREAGLSLVFLLGIKQLLQCVFLWYSLVGMYLSAGRWLYILWKAVSAVGV